MLFFRRTYGFALSISAISPPKKVYADSLKEEGMALGADEMDDLVQTVVVNTIKGGNDEYLKNNAYTIAESIMSKTELLRSLREDITEMLKSNLPDDIRLKGDFTKDSQFMDYLKTIHDVQNAVQESGDADPEIEDVTASILVPKSEEKPEEKKKRKMGFKSILKPRGKGDKLIFEISKVKRGKRPVKIKKEKIKKIGKGSKNEKQIIFNIDKVIKKIEEKPEEEEEEIKEPKEKREIKSESEGGDES